MTAPSAPKEPKVHPDLARIVAVFSLVFVALLVAATAVAFPPIAVVALAVALRFLDGYVAPLIFQAIAQQHPDDEERDAIVTIVAVVQSTANFAAAWAIFGLVAAGAIAASDER